MDVEKIARELQHLSPIERQALAHHLAERDGFSLAESPRDVLQRAEDAIVEIHAAERARSGKDLRPEEARERLKTKDRELYDAMVEASQAWTRG